MQFLILSVPYLYFVLPPPSPEFLKERDQIACWRWKQNFCSLSVVRVDGWELFGSSCVGHCCIPPLSHPMTGRLACRAFPVCLPAHHRRRPRHLHTTPTPNPHLQRHRLAGFQEGGGVLSMQFLRGAPPPTVYFSDRPNDPWRQPAFPRLSRTLTPIAASLMCACFHPCACGWGYGCVWFVLDLVGLY